MLASKVSNIGGCWAPIPNSSSPPPATPWSLRLISHLASQPGYRLVGDLYCLSVDKADSLSDSAGRESAMLTTLWIRV